MEKESPGNWQRSKNSCHRETQAGHNRSLTEIRNLPAAVGGAGRAPGFRDPVGTAGVYHANVYVV